METTERARLAELRRYKVLGTEPEAGFDRLTQLAARICLAPMALISLVDEHRLWLKSAFGLAAGEASREQTLCAHAILGSEPLVVDDVKRDARFAAGPPVCGDPHARFYAGVPLRSPGGIALGTLCVIDVRPRTLTGDQIESLKLLAGQIMQQFESRIVAESLRRQSASLAQTEATAHIGGWELVLDTQDLTWSEETYRIHELDPAEYAPDLASAISYYSVASAVQIRQAVDDLVDQGIPFDLELQLVTKAGRHRWVRATGRRDGWVDDSHIIYGVFQDITERRNLESEVILITQREQSRIGLDLHDGLGQTLTGVSLMLSHATQAVPDGLPQLRDNLRELQGLVAEAIGTCRTLARGLAPVSQQGGGLPHALRQLAMRLAHLHGRRISVDVRGFARPPETVSDHLYRIVQEALTNAIRHSGAQHIELDVDLNPAQICIYVVDDGRHAGETAFSEGMGISIMRYRARLIGAVFSMDHRPNGGIEVSCVLNMAQIGEPVSNAPWALHNWPL